MERSSFQSAGRELPRSLSPADRLGRASLRLVSLRLVRIRERESPRRRNADWIGKRMFDVFSALGLGLILSPLMLAIAAGLLVTGRPVLFTQTRIGRDGRQFRCFKFRTMVPDAERILADLLESNPDLRAEWLRDQKLRNDPRVTRIGKLLRKTSLDELPQLWNVFVGDMSLVGPRPILEEELRRYGRSARFYLAARPGLTGLWQVLGRNQTTYRERVAMDRYYSTTCSVWGDLGILLRTALVVVARVGAY